MQSRIPDDHYRYIVCHVRNRKDLLSLRLTSRALGYEAEKVLYRTVELNNFNKSVRPVLSHLASSPRTASHVERFSITFDLGIPFWHTPQSVWMIRGFLYKAYNLKELRLITNGGSEMTLGRLTEGVKFKLRYLACSLTVSESCSRFIRSQTDIVHLYWLSGSGPTLTRSDLPNLTTLETGKHTKFIMTLLPGRKVIRLKLDRLRRSLGGNFNTIQVLHIYRKTREDILLSQYFPNIRYLSAIFSKPYHALFFVQELVTLQKFIVTCTPLVVDLQVGIEFATELFSTLPTLRHIELSDGYWCWRLERGVENKPAQVPLSLQRIDVDEWVSWSPLVPQLG